MVIVNKPLEYFKKQDNFVLTTKYPYELEAIINCATVVAIVNDWRLAAKFHDVLTEYTRLKQMDNSIPPIEELIYLVFYCMDTDTQYVIADAYIEDMYKL